MRHLYTTITLTYNYKERTSDVTTSLVLSCPLLSLTPDNHHTYHPTPKQGTRGELKGLWGGLSIRMVLLYEHKTFVYNQSTPNNTLLGLCG